LILCFNLAGYKRTANKKREIKKNTYKHYIQKS
jgi:hypothetical protein